MRIALNQARDESVHERLQVDHEGAYRDIVPDASLLCFRAQAGAHSLIENRLLVFPPDAKRRIGSYQRGNLKARGQPVVAFRVTQHLSHHFNKTIVGDNFCLAQGIFLS